jgi:hypothetical protein
MLTRDQARELVVSQLAFDFRADNADALIESEFEREWGWLFLYPGWGPGGKRAGWIVNRHSSEMKHLPEVSAPEEAMADYERGRGS